MCRALHSVTLILNSSSLNPSLKTGLYFDLEQKRCWGSLDRPLHAVVLTYPYTDCNPAIFCYFYTKSLLFVRGVDDGLSDDFTFDIWAFLCRAMLIDWKVCLGVATFDRTVGGSLLLALINDRFCRTSVVFSYLLLSPVLSWISPVNGTNKLQLAGQCQQRIYIMGTMHVAL